MIALILFVIAFVFFFIGNLNNVAKLVFHARSGQQVEMIHAGTWIALVLTITGIVILYAL